MRGHGQSDCPHGPWNIQDLVDDLAAFIEGVDAAPCHLVGMSIGGMSAVRLALQRPELLRSLTLVNTSADAEDPGKIPQYQAFQSVIAQDGLSDDLAMATLCLLFGDRYMGAESEAVAIHVARLKEMPHEGHVETMRMLVERDSVVERLPQLDVPTLVIHGEQDASIPISQGETLASRIPDAELVRVPGVGHTAPLEAPDLVNGALAGFLSRVS
jgi:pimeloyl-ACP methyl ester carboxylesterase